MNDDETMKTNAKFELNKRMNSRKWQGPDTAHNYGYGECPYCMSSEYAEQSDDYFYCSKCGAEYEYETEIVWRIYVIHEKPRVPR
jgi:hypothetical protein